MGSTRCVSPMFAVILMLGASVAAQSRVWTVDDDGPADFASIQDAIDAAADGDTVLVQDGFYTGGFFVAGKSLVVTAERDATVVSSYASVWNLVAGQVVVLRGIDLVGEFPTEPVAVLFTSNNAGVVWIEDADLLAPSVQQIPYPGNFTGQGALVVSRSARVVGVDLAVSGNDGIPDVLSSFGAGPGLEVQVRSRLALYESTVDGGSGYDGLVDWQAIGLPGGDGGAGLEARGSEVYVAGGSVQGGLGGAGLSGAFCSDGGLGGSGLFLGDDGFGLPTVLEQAGTTVVSGVGGLTSGLCQDGSAAPTTVVDPDSTLITTAIEPAVLAARSPVRGGESLDLVFEGQRSDLVFLLFGLDPSYTHTAATGRLHVSAPKVLALGTVPATGTLSVSFRAPAPPAGFDAITLFLQGAAVDAFGDVVLSSPTAVTALDPTL